MEFLTEILELATIERCSWAEKLTEIRASGVLVNVDFIALSEGKTEIAANGLPATCYFLLSTKDCDTHTVGETLASANLGEITGTGYARLTESEPSPAAGVVSFAQKSWATGTRTDWPASVKSVVLVTGATTTGKALCAWNLQTGGAARDMSAANTTENVTPTLQVG